MEERPVKLKIGISKEQIDSVGNPNYEGKYPVSQRSKAICFS